MTIVLDDVVFGIIPSEYREKFEKLRPARKMILLTYFQIHKIDPRSPHQIIPKIANRLNYTIDVNGSNSFLLQVIQEFFSRK